MSAAAPEINAATSIDPATMERGACKRCLSREAEADRILQHYGENALPDVMSMLERQFGVLHNRAQVLLALCGIIVSSVGFSGRTIAITGPWAKMLIIAGMVLILIAAGVTCWGVLHLRWLTMQTGGDTRRWLMTSLEYRDRKTFSYRIGVALMLMGLTAYTAAILIMLIHPEAAPLVIPR
jgi:hypothetical protein